MSMEKADVAIICGRDDKIYIVNKEMELDVIEPGDGCIAVCSRDELGKDIFLSEEDAREEINKRKKGTRK